MKPGELFFMADIQHTDSRSYTEERLRRESASEGKGGNGKESIRSFYGDSDGSKRLGTSEIMSRDIRHSESKRAPFPILVSIQEKSCKV